MNFPEKLIRASYNEQTVTVYQAYNAVIASSAIKAQTFVSPPFKKERMTWIKPSFLWMMYRSGWATKENQEHILAIEIKRHAFDWALNNGCLSYFEKTLYSSTEIWKQSLLKSSARIQWDPERDIFLQPLNYRTIQIGLGVAAVEKYTSEWIVQIKDITENCKKIHRLIREGKSSQAKRDIPLEIIYPLSSTAAHKLGIL